MASVMPAVFSPVTKCREQCLIDKDYSSIDFSLRLRN